MTIAFLILGLIVLTAGAELLVRGASRLATSVGISPLVVGLTVVAFGTSTPELVVSIQSALLDKPDVALGNVVGSNIFNVLFILGISALIVPLRVALQIIRIEVPLMIALSLLVWIFALDGRISRWDGSILAVGLLVYIVYSIAMSRRQESAVRTEQPFQDPELQTSRTAPVDRGDELGRTVPDSGDKVASAFGWGIDVLLIAAGLILLVLGSRWFIESATAIARDVGISELIIGLTLVAAGTSLPEVATSILAAIRGERDIAVGNVVGSNLFNILGVLGISSCISSQGIQISEVALWMDIPVMIAAAIACLPIFYTGHLIARWEGGLFLAYYLAYTWYLILSATSPNLTRSFALVMALVVIPLTMVTLMIGVARHRRNTSNLRDEI